MGIGRVALIDMNRSHLLLAVSLIIILSSAPIAYAVFLTPVEIIDNTGDGGGNTLSLAREIATDSSGNVFVTGQNSDNAFKITPGGAITQIIDATGDGVGNTLSEPFVVATDSSGNVFVSGFGSNNAFKLELQALIGGTSIPIDTTTLLIAGFNANSIWMIPTVLCIAGAGLVIQLVRRKKPENS